MATYVIHLETDQEVPTGVLEEILAETLNRDHVAVYVVDANRTDEEG